MQYVPVRKYREFRLSKRNTQEFCHLKLLLYWPAFGFAFLFVERLSPISTYTAVHCGIDDLIPFCEYFVIPYLFWFVYLVGMHLYTLWYDIEAFQKMMKFIMISYTITILIYLVFPTCQNLRPTEFARDNLFTSFLAGFYQFDTNTNVCPSIHVLGTMAVWHTSRAIPRFRTPLWTTLFTGAAVLICLSTVFLKQHSVIDILAAIPVCLIAYYFSFRRTSHAGR